jgi:hypothetical protein
MFPLFIELCLLVSMQADPVRAHELWQAQAKTSAISAASAQSAALAEKKKEFEVRFNRLTEAVAEFSREYNRNQGQAWPKQKADALKKAMRELQEAEAWLQK